MAETTPGIKRVDVGCDILGSEHVPTLYELTTIAEHLLPPDKFERMVNQIYTADSNPLRITIALNAISYQAALIQAQVYNDAPPRTKVIIDKNLAPSQVNIFCPPEVSPTIQT